MAAEIFLDVVNDNCLRQVATRPLQVLNIVLGGTRLHIFDLESVLAVESVRDRPLLVKCIQYLVRVLHKNVKQSKVVQ